MKKLLHNPIGIIAALVMVATLLVIPQTSLARVMISDGTHPGGPGGGEGDPLDSNDYSGGGGGESHEQRIIPRGSGWVLFETSASQVIMLRVNYIEDIPVFSIYIISASELQAEASHVR